MANSYEEYLQALQHERGVQIDALSHQQFFKFNDLSLKFLDLENVIHLQRFIPLVNVVLVVH